MANLLALGGEIIGGGGSSLSASDIIYNNTTSGLSSTNVQGAIDILANKLADKTELAYDVNLYRIGNVRILSVTGATVGTITGLTISSGDRPSVAQCVSVPYYAYTGLFYIYTDGSITIKYYSSYADNTSLTDANSTYSVRFNVIWGV